MAAEKGVERSFWMVVFLLLVLCFGLVFGFLFMFFCLWGLCFMSSWVTMVSTPWRRWSYALDKACLISFVLCGDGVGWLGVMVVGIGCGVSYFFCCVG